MFTFYSFVCSNVSVDISVVDLNLYLQSNYLICRAELANNAVIFAFVGLLAVVLLKKKLVSNKGL